MITLSKLAKLANVSVSTASKAFSGSTEISDETRELVFSEAKKHGCFKRFYNVKYPKLVIAMIAPEFSSAQYTRYLNIIQSLLKDSCELCVSTTNFSEQQERALIEYYYLHANVDGMIIIGAHCDTSDFCEIPIVHIHPKAKQRSEAVVTSSSQTAIFESIQYLAEKNVQTVGFIGESLTARKFEAFRQAMDENRINFDKCYVSITDQRFEAGGYAAMEKLCSAEHLPRAIICAYDYMAIGAIRCIRDHGLSVPRDIAVMGMDDIPQARYLDPPLASISLCTEEQCRLASQMLLNMIHANAQPQATCIDAMFHLRESFEI